MNQDGLSLIIDMVCNCSNLCLSLHKQKHSETDTCISHEL